MTRDEREERERKQVSREIGLMRMRLEKMEKISDYSYPSTREQGSPPRMRGKRGL